MTCYPKFLLKLEPHAVHTKFRFSHAVSYRFLYMACLGGSTHCFALFIAPLYLHARFLERTLLGTSVHYFWQFSRGFKSAPAVLTTTCLETVWSCPFHLILIPNTKRHPNNTKQYQNGLIICFEVNFFTVL